MIGRTLAHYRIDAAIGAGGMGEVYRAADTKLGRDVALKVLPPEVAGDPDRLARFQREARAVAALNHPNVVTLYSVEESNGVHFLTMELIEGQPLDHLISSSGLPADRLIEIAGAIAEALAAAHEKGIVHRDLKPANVMLTNEGRVKVLDFGLAKEISAESSNDATMTSDGHTQAGMVMGTPSYMSPEQVSGRTLDHRTDIFSLGVLLHEMATGQRPFVGTSSAELISSILRDTPASVSELRTDLPTDLVRVIRRCLEKDPRHRMQTARDVSNEFRDLARSTARTPPASAPRVSATADSGSARSDEAFWIAVLPFKYTGTNTDLISLAEGLSEEIVTGLSRFSYLKVIARSSTARYAGQSVDVRQAGKELNARYVMEGTLRQASSKLRLAAQVVDAASGAHLWAENYERSFSPEAVFELQDDLVPRIVSTVADMNGVLPRSMSEGLRNRSPEQLTPYEAVLRSFAYTYSATPEELTAARLVLEETVRKSPAYSDAWAMLSFLCGQDYVHGYELQGNALEVATSSARRAVALGPSNHLAYFSLGQALWCQKDYDSFRDAAERAVLLNPMDGNSVAYLGELLTYAGSVERGMELVARAKQLNPNHPGWYWFADFYHAFSQGDYRAALAFALKAKLRGNPLAPMFLAAACGQLGDVDGGANALGDLLRFRPELPAAMGKQVAKVWNAEYGERFLGGLRKAGMDIPEAEVPASGKMPTISVPGPPKRESGATRSAIREDEGFWVAVLPFKTATGDADLEALADGLTEDVTTGLARFPYLQVIAHNSALAYRGRAVDVRTLGRELGARYVMEGGIRRRGRAIRVTTQLMDAASGAQLWAETYDRELGDPQNNHTSTFQIQDDLTDHIVTGVADGHGVLVRSMAAPTRDRKVEELSASELVLRYYAFMQQVDLQEHAALRTGFERALEREPNHAVAWACLSNLYALEYGDGFNPQEKPIERAREVAWRAVKIDPACQMGWKLLSVVHFFSRDFAAFREAADRAISLNPRDGTTLAYVGIMMAYSGDWERGVAMVQRAIDLNRHHPGWYYNAAWAHHYRKGEYEAALLAAKKISMPEYHWFHIATAAAAGMLGRHDEARAAIDSLRKYSPAFLDLENVREEIARWDPDEDEVERLMQGLQKAGFKYGAAEHAASQSSASQAIPKADSASGRTDEGFWVAVLPFKYAGGNADLRALADGLTEEIITGLSRFSYLRVIARGSATKYSSESGDVRAIGKELGARYVMEASLRHAGSKLRLTVQLVDATTGSRVWAETYERTFKPETVFELQDELVPRIVSTVADAHGILPHTLGESIRSKNPEQLTPYEAVLRCFGYAERVSAEEHAITRAALEQAVHTAPNYAYGWALLSLTIKDEFESGFNPKPDPLERMLKAARRAIDLDPYGHRGFHALAIAHFYRKEIPAFRTAADRAIALNPMDGCNVAHLGSFIAYAGEWERGCGLVERALQLNPNHPGWFWFPLSMNAYRKGDYQAALESALKINLPNFLWTHTMLAATYGQLGQQAEAGKAVQELLKLNPQTAQVVGRALHARFDPDLVERLTEGLRKAGLDIGGQSVSGPEVFETDAASPALASNARSAAPATQASGAARAGVREDGGLWVAVLPFKYPGDSRDLKALADGLSEEIITGLSRFSYLRVIARGLTEKYSGDSGDIRNIGKELGARHVMEGTLRQSGATLRIAVQVIDATTGAHLWAQTYERAFRAEDVFAVQDDITDRVVATVADANGVLVQSIAAGVDEKPEVALTALDWMLLCFSYRRNVSPEAHAKLRDGLERFVEREPKNADVWACLALAYLDEFSFGFNMRPDALGRALAAARQSVNIDRACQMGNQILAQAHFFRKDIPAFRAATEEAIALNPRNTEAVAQMAMFYVFSGEFERGVTLARRAMDLNPKHAGWYHVPLVWDYFQKGEYELALDHEARINIPGLFWQPLAVAACCGLLGRKAEAAAAAEELRQLDKDIEQHLWRHIEIYNYASGFMDRILEGLAKAGLHIAVPAEASLNTEQSGPRNAESGTSAPVPAQTSSSRPVASRTASGEARTDEGFWVAVLPFKYTGSNTELKALAEGLTEEVITGMSRFSYLRVIARGSTVKYSGESGDVRDIGKEIGARYVMEASLRQAGSKLRLAVQLVDAVSGAHLWAETYEHAFTPESVFEVQDDLVPRIVSTVADQYGVLPRSMSDALRSRSEDALTPHEAVLRTFSYFTRLTPEEHASIRGTLERTVREAPDHADSWAMLSMIYRGEFAQGYNAQPNSLDRALAAAQRAVELASTHALGHYALATVHFFRKEMVPFRVAAERALALNPLDASVRAYLGLLIASAGEWDKGCEMVESAMRLNPNCPGYFYFARCWDNYRRGNYEETLRGVAATNTPNYFHVPAIQAAALAQLGRREEAQKAVQRLLSLRPDFASAARQEYSKWYDDEHVEQVLEGLRKAGLEIP